MKAKVYAKSTVDLSGSKLGAYALLFDGMDGEQYKSASKFKDKMFTLTQADCAAYVNALHILSKMACAPELTNIEIITDSGKVVDLLDIFKSEKHCDVLARHWRETVKPLFVKLEKIIYTKVPAKTIAGNKETSRLADCLIRAKGELNVHRNLLS